MAEETDFARLVSLACHDLRTPLATVHGFATTLERGGGLEPPADRYVEMINAASAQIAELIDELSLAARIESGRYDPSRREADTLGTLRPWLATTLFALILRAEGRARPRRHPPRDSWFKIRQLTDVLQCKFQHYFLAAGTEPCRTARTLKLAR